MRDEGRKYQFIEVERQISDSALGQRLRLSEGFELTSTFLVTAFDQEYFATGITRTTLELVVGLEKFGYFTLINNNFGRRCKNIRDSIVL